MFSADLLVSMDLYKSRRRFANVLVESKLYKAVTRLVLSVEARVWVCNYNINVCAGLCFTLVLYLSCYLPKQDYRHKF